MPLYRPSELKKLGIRAKKSLSQNFLIDQNILEKICTIAGIQERDQVLEIGPGPGVFTERLLEKGAKLIAVEKDKELAKLLERFEGENCQILCDDALTFPLEKIPSHCKVVANLPYQITAPLLGRLIPLFPQIQSLTLIVQKEVGERMCAKPNSSSYSNFSLFLQCYSTPKYCFTIKPNSFYPAPNVHSCVVHLTLHSFPFSFPEEDFFAFTRTAFGQKRKMLRASLKEKYGDVTHYLPSPTTRPGELSFEEFAKIFQQIYSQKREQKDTP